MKIVNIGMRVLQLLWTILVMALVGDMISDAYKGNPAIVNYCMFVAVFAMLSLIYLFLATIKEDMAISPLFPLIVDMLNVLFWFAAAVAMAAQLGVHSCSNSSWVNRNYITNGNHPTNDQISDDNNENVSNNDNPNAGRCREAQASTVFLFFGFIAFAVSAVLSGLATRGGASIRPSGIRRGPAMSQA